MLLCSFLPGWRKRDVGERKVVWIMSLHKTQSTQTLLGEAWGGRTLPWRRISVRGFSWMSDGRVSLPLVSRVPAAWFPSRFCVRCLHILYERSSVLRQCDGKVFLHFSVHVFFAHVNKIKRLRRLEVKLILEKLELLFLSHYHVYTLLKYFFYFSITVDIKYVSFRYTT